MKVAAFLLAAAVAALPQNTSLTRGRCSPAITEAGANVTITYQSNSCPELDASTVTALKAFIARFPKTVDRLNELLDKKDVELESRSKEVQGWISKYTELEKQLAERGDDSELSRQAAAKLRDNDLEGAGKLLDEIISRGEAQVDRLAQDHFNRGRIYELQFRMDRALPHYKKAAGYRPENTQYDFAYAYALAEQNLHREAISVYETLTATYRKLARDNPAAYLPDAAAILNNLGNLYSNNQRFVDAVNLYSEALSTYRKLANDKPAAYLPDVAMTLNNLGNLHRITQRFADADKAFSETLSIRRKLADDNPAAYLPDVAVTLNNLGVLYRDTQRFADADKAFSEALLIRRKLAQANPAAYLPNVAVTLSNLGVLCRDTQRFEDADKAFSEALSIYRRLALDNPAAYLPDVAMTLNNLGVLYRGSQRFEDAEKAYSEALSSYRKLARDNPAVYLPDVAMTLNNLGFLYRGAQRFADAGKVYSEALFTYRKLANDNPATFVPRLASTLLSAGLLNLALNQNDKACAAYQDYRSLQFPRTPDWASELEKACR